MDPMLIAGLGTGLVGAIGAMQQRKQMNEYHRKSLEQAEGGLLQNREQLQAINPQASANAALAHVSEAQSAALNQAANVGAGQAAASGLGGDISSASISSLKAAQPVMAAAAQFGAQKAQIEQNAVGEDLQKQGQLTQLNTSLADTSRNSNITFQNKPTMLDALLGGMAGANGAVSIYDMLRKNSKDTTDPLLPGGGNSNPNQSGA